MARSLQHKNGSVTKLRSSSKSLAVSVVTPAQQHRLCKKALSAGIITGGKMLVVLKKKVESGFEKLNLLTSADINIARQQVLPHIRSGFVSA